MLKKVMMFIGALVLVMSAFAGQVFEQTIYAVAAKQADQLEAHLRTLSAEENGQMMPVVEGDEVYLARLATSLHGWAILKGYLAEAAVKDHRLFQQALTERYSEKRNIKELIGLAAQGKFLIPAKVASATAQAAVAAASAPSVTAPAVAQAPAPAVKSAPVVAKTESEVVTRPEFQAAIAEQKKLIEGNSDARVAFYEKRISQFAEGLEAKAVAGFKRKAAEALLKSEPELLAKVQERIDAKDKARGEQIAAVGGHVDRVEGRLTDMEQGLTGFKKEVNDLVGQFGSKFNWTILVGLLLLVGVAGFLYRRITTVKKEADNKAVQVAKQAMDDAVIAAAQNTEQQLDSLRKVVAKKAGREEFDELKERVGAIDDYLGVDSAWAMSLDEKAELQDRLFGLKVDERVLYAVPRSGEVERQLRFIKINDDQVCVEGIDKHDVTDPVNINNVARIITKANHAKRLRGVDLKKVKVVHQLEAA